MPNVDHVAWLKQGIDAWNTRRETNDFLPDFAGPSEGQPPLAGLNLRGANLSGADFSNSMQSGVNFTGTQLKGAKFCTALLSGANFTGSDLRDADFTDSYLTTTQRDVGIVSSIRLGPADLSNATLNGANFSGAHLAGVDFGNAQPWTSVLFPEPNRPTQHFVGDKPVQTIEDLLRVVRLLNGAYEAQQPDEGITLYFRGEPKWGEAGEDWHLSPAVHRDHFAAYESQMLVDLESLHPTEFSDLPNALSKWVYAQHHLLRTRFLDITKNPLVALFFACETHRQHEGKLHIFAVPRKIVKSFNSDTVSIVANFARLPKHEQDMILGKPMGDVRMGDDYISIMGKLYQLIQEEKPGFVQRIEIKDLFGVYVIEPQYSSERIKAQSGAMLGSAYHERFERASIEQIRNVNVFGHYTLTVAADTYKTTLMNDLRLFNITRQTLFPGLDESAQEVQRRYSSLKY